jgi:hypothetical protein
MTEAPGTDLSTLYALCDSDEPLVAGLANSMVSYALESADDPDGALVAAKRTLTAFQGLGVPALLATARSRVGELCLVVDRPDEARRHISEILPVVDAVGAWATAVRGRWVLVLADLQRGAVDEAEHGLEQAVRGGGDDVLGMAMFDVAVRAEILLARGQVEAGLRLWRRVADRVRDDLSEPWAQQVYAVTVVSHAHHGRLDLVEEIAGELPHVLSRRITSAVAESPSSFTDFPISGALLLALGMVELDRGDPCAGARMIALAERFRFVRGFQPTMSAARARQAAERADRSAYADAVSSYAGLAPDAVRAEALAALRAGHAGSLLNSARAQR